MQEEQKGRLGIAEIGNKAEITEMVHIVLGTALACRGFAFPVCSTERALGKGKP